MKKNSKSKSSKRAKSTAVGAGEVAARNLRAYQQTVREAGRMQTQTANELSGALTHAISMSDWQSAWARMAQMTGELMPLAQRQMQGLMELIETNSRTGSELLRKSMDAAQSLTPLSGVKWMDLWTTSLRAFQANSTTLSQVATRNLTSWMRMMRIDSQTA